VFKIKEEFYVIGIKTHALDKKDSMENIINKAEVFGFEKFKQKIIQIFKETVELKKEYLNIYEKVKKLSESENFINELQSIENLLGINNSDLPKKEKHVLPVLENRKNYLKTCFDFYLSNQTENKKEVKVYLRTEAPNNDYLELRTNLRNLKEWNQTPLFNKKNPLKESENIKTLEDVISLLGI